MGGMDMIKWWVNGSCVVHRDVHRQTGVTISMGRDSVYSTSQNQKINMNISTEIELVAVDDIELRLLWISYFLEEQGCSIVNSKIYQGNCSTILLKTNENPSSRNRTRQINLRYLFIKDRVNNGGWKYSTSQQKKCWGGFIKPLQSKKFHQFKTKTLGIVN